MTYRAALPCKRGAVVMIRRECIGCQGVDHRGRERLDADKAIQMEYQIVIEPDTDNERVLGYVCTKGCAKRIGAHVNWKNQF